MSLFEPIAMAVLNSWLSRPEKQRSVKMSGLWLLAVSCVLSCAGVVYLLIAFNTWMVAQYGAVVAALATAGGAFVLAGIAAAGFVQVEKKPPPQHPANGDSVIQTAEALFAALEQATGGLEEPIANNPRTSVALASLAGYMTADKVH